jgi:hypothetical protein
MDNLPFTVKFTIFDENKKLTRKQEILRETIVNDINDRIIEILQESIKDDPQFKMLDRAEPSISNIDETKQLRLRLSNLFCTENKNKYSLHFYQGHSTENFTMKELKYIANKIKDELEIFLRYDIDTIIYIEIDEIDDMEIDDNDRPPLK